MVATGGNVDDSGGSHGVERSIGLEVWNRWVGFKSNLLVRTCGSEFD